MANKTAALLLPGQRGLPVFPPPSTVVQQHAEQHQLGSMTVNFKMSVVTSGPHDGLFITTGIQTNNSNSGANGGTAPGNAWWRSMDQLALQQTLTPAPTAGILPIESLRTALGEGAAKSVGQSPFPAVEESRSRAIDSMYSRSMSGMEDPYKAASINEEYFKTSTAVRSPSPQPAPLPRQRRSTLINGGEKSPRHSSPNTRIGGLTLTEENGDYSWSNREGKVAGRYEERSIPIKLDAPSQESTIKLNTFNHNSGNADISGQVVELKLNPADEYLLNDTTTTTTTLEVFRSGNDHSNHVDYYKLPPDPFSQGFEPRYVKADGPPYEMSTRTETRFSDRARHSADASFASPTQQYYVTEPANTSMSEAIRWGQPDAGASRPQSGDQARSESRPVSSTSPLSSNWNVEQQSAPPAPAATTILRRQRNEHRDRRVVPRQGFEGTERTCPPVPPKPLAYHQLRRGVSQPELPTHYRGVSGARLVPPRPTTRKPHLRVPPSHSHRSRSAGGERLPGEGRVRSTSVQPPSYLQPEQLRRYLESAPDARRGRAERPRSAVAYYPPPMTEEQGMGARSASVNEIFKLYQTRDCLGRVVQQLRLRAFLLSRQPEEKEGLSPPFRLTSTTVREADSGEEEEEAEFDDESGNGISLDELLFSLKELDIYEDTMTSTSSSSFISDLSPRAEWTRSRFMEPLEGEDIGISLNSGSSEPLTSPTTTADAVSVDELKGLIARHTPLVDNPISPHLLRLPQLERTLSTLDELSSEEREDAASLGPSLTASESTINKSTAIDSRQVIVAAKTIFPARTTADDGGGKLTHIMNELASRVEDLEPRDLLSEIFPSFAHLRPNEDERRGNLSLLPPLPKRPAPPSTQRTRAGRSRPAPLACSKSEEDYVLEFENLESEPRRAGMAAARGARVTNTNSPNSTQPKFHLVADGFRLRIVND